MKLSPVEVDIAVRIVERLALQAPPASLVYPSGDISRGKPEPRWTQDWPSGPVPNLEDETFGLAGDTLMRLRAMMNQHFGGSPLGASASGGESISAGAAIEGASRGGLGAAASGVYFAGSPGCETAAATAAAAIGSKPSFCMVAGDALGGRLLGWCTVACRSPQWREAFLVGEVTSSWPPTPAGDTPSRDGDGSVAGVKRNAEDMEGAPVEGEPGGAHDAVVAGGDPMDEDAEDLSGDGLVPGPGLAQLLSVVGQVVHAVREHPKALTTAWGRASGAGFVPRVGGARSFDPCTRESSGAAQNLVGALADAVMDTFYDHLVDPALHRQLQGLPCDGAATGFSPRGAAMVMAEVAPLIDGASQGEMAGLSVGLLNDMAWLFSSLEPETGGSSAGGTVRGDRGSASKADPAATLLSSAMSCWAAGRLLACMPGREQLEYALGLPHVIGASRSAASTEQPSSVARGTPSVRPLPAKLACFAVRTLLENVQVAREKGSEATECSPLPEGRAGVPIAGGGQSDVLEFTAARACARRSNAFFRVALISEQMPAWRERWQDRRRWWRSSADGGGISDTDAAHDDTSVAADAGAAAAAEVLHALVALLCAATEHERLNSVRREQAEASGAQRRPTMYSVGSIVNLVGPALTAMSVLLGPSLPSGARGGTGSSQVGAASTRSAPLSRGKKRRGSAGGGVSITSGATGVSLSPSAASSAGDSRWAALVGLQLPAWLDRLHLAGMLLAWEPWHPWVEKAAQAATPAGVTRSTQVSLRRSRSWQTFCSLSTLLAQACVAPRPAPPPGRGVAAVVTRAVVSFRSATGRADPVQFLDMPAVLLLSKVSSQSCGTAAHFIYEKRSHKITAESTPLYNVTFCFCIFLFYFFIVLPDLALMAAYLVSSVV